MADDLGGMIIKIEIDESQSTEAFKKAGKAGGMKISDEIVKAFRKTAGDAAAAIGGARAKGATNLFLATGGMKGLIGKITGRGAAAAGAGAGAAGAGGAAAGGVGAGAAAAGGGAGAAAASGPFAPIMLAILVATAGLVLLTRAMNKRTSADRDRLANLNPTLALQRAQENVTMMMRNIVEGRIFGDQIAANSRRLLQAGNEFFKFKLIIKSVTIQFKTAASFITLWLAKLLNFITEAVTIMIKDLFAIIMKMLELLGLTSGAESLGDIEQRRKEGQDAISQALARILREMQLLSSAGNYDGMNRIMTLEIRNMSKPMRRLKEGRVIR